MRRDPSHPTTDQIRFRSAHSRIMPEVELPSHISDTLSRRSGTHHLEGRLVVTEGGERGQIVFH
jgi:hypothetical protein